MNVLESDSFSRWGLSYNGTATVARGRKLFSSTLATGCFAVSTNFIEVRRAIPKGGNIATALGELATSFCPNERSKNILRLKATNNDNSNYAYIAVNEEDKVVGITRVDSFDLTGLAQGNYRVWGISFRGELNANLLGKDIFEVYLADDCYSLSSNSIAVSIGDLNAGIIVSNTGEEAIDLCAANRFLKFTNNQDVVENYAYLLTNERGTIARILLDSNTLDINTIGAGYYELFGVVFTGAFQAKVGDNINSSAFSSGCYDVSRNRLMLLKSEVEIGEITTVAGEKELVYCSNNKIAVKPSNTLFNTVYVLTDENNVIQQISALPNIDIVADAANLRLHAVTFTGNWTAQIGDDFNHVSLSDVCFDRSDNFITIKKINPVGGKVSLSGSSSTSFFACPQESNTLIVSISKTAHQGLNYTFVVVDEADIVQQISTTGVLMFEEAVSGKFNVYGVAHLAPLSVELGDLFADGKDFSPECIDVSENSVEIIWQEPSGGTIKTLTDEAVAYTCPDSEASLVRLKKENTAGSNYEYILATAELEIVGYSNSNFRLDTLPEGNYLIYGIAYTGGLNNQTGEKLDAVPLASGCYSLSTNAVKVFHFTPASTIVATADFSPSVSVCSASNAPAIIEVKNTGDENNAYAYILTDADNKVIAIFDSSKVTLDRNANAARRIWGLSYTGALLLKVGDKVDQATAASGCFAISINYVEVTVRQVVNGNISSFQDLNQVYVCYGDGAPDFVGFYPLEATNASYRFVITDVNNVVLRVMTGNIQNFETTGPITSRVWGVSYTGALSIRAGQNIMTSKLSDDCYALSNNFVEIIRTQLDGGSITINNSTQPIEICAGAGEAQRFTLSNNSRSVARYSYILTDENNTVLQLTQTTTLDVASFEQTVIKVWGVAHTEVLNLKVGDNLFSTTVSTGCYDLASNNLTIRRQLVSAGTISDANGNTEVYVCPDDAIADIVAFRHSGIEQQDYRYVITDDTNKALVILTGDTYNFAGLPAGVYRVWGISFNGEFTATLGMTISAATSLSTNCYQLSENYLAVYRSSPIVDQITTEDGANSKIVYVSDQTLDPVRFNFPQGAGGQPMLIITNTQGIIITVATSDTYEFNDFAVGFYRVYGALFTGESQLKVGAIYNRQNISTGCFATTNNYVQLICAPAGRGGATTSGGNTGLSLLQNPVVADIQLQLRLDEPTAVQIRVFNAVGQVMHQEKINTLSGTNQIDITASNWTDGVYLIQVQTATGIQTISCLKQSL
ncbi:MAG: T9SS type A sorting domain-containing protein [Saprospiraceae bacterium]|nr:T9SS type A sorting domain-containing protein [Saprospiraceae bacterium]